jgi:hypothetical protein
MPADGRLLAFLLQTGFFERTIGVLVSSSRLPAASLRPLTLKSVLDRLGPREDNIMFMESVVAALDLSHEYTAPETAVIYTDLATFLVEFLKPHIADVYEFWESLPHAPAPAAELAKLTGVVTSL